MKSMRIVKRAVVLLLAAAMLAFALPLASAAGKDTRQLLDAAAGYMLSAVRKPGIGSIGGEWAVIGLARSGKDAGEDYYRSYYAAVEEYVTERGGVLSKNAYTEYSRVILGVTAAGRDARNVAGYDLTLPLGDFNSTVKQGINGPIWALIALDSGNYDMPADNTAEIQATRQMYVDEILSRQLDCGGWNLSEKGGAGTAEADITAMALQALAQYRSQAGVSAACERAIACLSEMQNEQGGFSAFGDDNSESPAQVIIALCALGISPSDKRFEKNGVTVLDNLLSFRTSNGGFRHTASGSTNQMASEQGLCALAALWRYEEGKNSLYDMSDVEKVSGSAAGDGLPGRNADVRRMPVSAPGTTFADIAGAECQKAVEELAARGIINGMGDGTFAPEQTMTRAQFAAIVTRGLGLEEQPGDIFKDVPADKWYAGYIGTAYDYGIIKGRSADEFDPEGTITRQEAATMVARAAKLCGMDTELNEAAVRNVLAMFDDYLTVDNWAKASLAFCYNSGIMDDSAMEIVPLEKIQRAEIAQMIYNMLAAGKLL